VWEALRGFERLWEEEEGGRRGGGRRQETDAGLTGRSDLAIQLVDISQKLARDPLLVVDLDRTLDQEVRDVVPRSEVCMVMEDDQSKGKGRDGYRNGRSQKRWGLVRVLGLEDR
jgi:hypothetical protein